MFAAAFSTVFCEFQEPSNGKLECETETFARYDLLSSNALLELERAESFNETSEFLRLQPPISSPAKKARRRTSLFRFSRVSEGSSASSLDSSSTTSHVLEPQDSAQARWRGLFQSCLPVSKKLTEAPGHPVATDDSGVSVPGPSEGPPAEHAGEPMRTESMRSVSFAAKAVNGGQTNTQDSKPDDQSSNKPLSEALGVFVTDYLRAALLKERSNALRHGHLERLICAVLEFAMYDKTVLESFSGLVGPSPNPDVFGETYIVDKDSESFKKVLKTLFTRSNNESPTAAQKQAAEHFQLSKKFQDAFEKDESDRGSRRLLKEPAFWSEQVIVLLGAASAETTFKQLVNTPGHFFYHMVTMSIQIILLNHQTLEIKEKKETISEQMEMALTGLETDAKARALLSDPKIFGTICKRFRKENDIFRGFEVIDFETIAKNGCDVDQ